MTIKRILGLAVISWFILLAGANAQDGARQLRVSNNGHYLEYNDGTPFFYLGDTAWELFHRLNREEAEQYLKKRAEQEFTVIQAVALAELGGLTVPNAYGELPLLESDPARPNEKYFEHVDFIISKAQDMGLFIGLLPTWGSYWKIRDNGDYSRFNPDNAYEFGKFLGRRYRTYPVIWILGGDNNISNEKERTIIEAMARGLSEGDEGAHLISYHPRGPGLSSDFFHQAEWLDFNMIQSSHGARDHDNGIFTEHDYNLNPAKPTLDGEPRYERVPVGFYNRNANPFERFDDFDARQAAWWSLLSGACGHTYGNNSVWQMWAPGRDPVIQASSPWFEALNDPGAQQMKFLRRLFESRPYRDLIPDKSMVVDGPKDGKTKIKATRASDGSFAFVYSPYGESFTVQMNAIRATTIAAYWYDPRYGTTEHLHTSDTKGYQTFTPPTSGRGSDWILILEDNKKFPGKPGMK